MKKFDRLRGSRVALVSHGRELVDLGLAHWDMGQRYAGRVMVLCGSAMQLAALMSAPKGAQSR